MDVGTIIGCILGGLLILGAAVFGGHDVFTSFWNTPSILIVFGGTASALFIAFPLKSIRKSVSAARKCLTNVQHDPQETIGEIVSFSEATRRTGLLAQESRIDSVRDPFLAEALHLIVDGLPPTMVESILSSEIEAMQQRHRQGWNTALYCGKYAPAFGMIGTLIGLVMMLTHLDAETVGPGMAVAVLTTLYGIIAANLVFLPIAEKLKQLHEAEMQIKALIIRGVLAIQAGEHPRIIEQRLQTFLPPNERSIELREKIVVTEDAAIPLPAAEEVEKQAA